MAVIIGVFHMMKGICIKGINAIYFRNWIVLCFEVVTGLIILGGLFAWMDVLIFGKWFNDYKAYNFLIPHGVDASDADVANYEY